MQVNYLRSLPFPFGKLLGLNVYMFADGNDGGKGGNGSSGSDGSKNTGGSDDSKNTGDKIDDKSFQLGVNKATAKWKAELEKLQVQLKEFEKMKEEIENQKTEAEIKDLEKKKEYQAIIEKNQKMFEEKETKYKQQIGTYESDLRRLIIESEIAKVAPDIKVIPEAMQDFIKITSPLMGYEKVEIDGRIDYKVYPSNNGNPLINEKGQEMTIKEFLEKFIEDKSYFKQALAQSGSGSKGGRSSGQQITNSRDAIHVGLQKLYKGK